MDNNSEDHREWSRGLINVAYAELSGKAGQLEKENKELRELVEEAAELLKIIHIYHAYDLRQKIYSDLVNFHNKLKEIEGE